MYQIAVVQTTSRKNNVSNLDVVLAMPNTIQKMRPQNAAVLAVLTNHTHKRNASHLSMALAMHSNEAQLSQIAVARAILTQHTQM